MACSEFEVAIEMRLRGALEVENATALDRHLEGCAACRSYADLAMRTEDTMHQAATESTRQVDWSALEGRVRKMQNLYRAALWRTALGLAMLLPAIVLLSMGPLVQPIGWALGAALGIAILWQTAADRRRWLRDVKGAETNRADLLAFWRRDLDRRILANRFGPLQVLAGACLLLPLFVGPQMPRLQVAGTIFAALLMVGPGLWSWLWLRPRLRRERAELD